MLIVRTLKLNIFLNRTHQFCFFSGALMNYQKFFKEVQKASKPQEVVKLYHTYANQKDNYDKYLAITMRILTRTSKSKDQLQKTIIREFLNNSIDKILNIDINKIEDQNIKDILLFFYQHSAFETNPNPTHVAIVERFLAEFISRHRKYKPLQNLKYAPSLFSCIKLANLYCPALEENIVNLLVPLLYSHQDVLLSDHTTLYILLQTLRNIYDPFNPHHQHLIHSLFFLLSNQQLSKIYDSFSLSNILISVLKIKSSRVSSNSPSTTTLLTQLQQQIEEILINNISQFSQQLFQFIIPSLLLYQPSSPLLLKYYQIIIKTVEPHSGKCKINPLTPAWALTHLTPIQFAKLIPPSWQTTFIAMTKHYFHYQRPFHFTIQFQFLKILQSQLLDWQYHLQLYNFYFTQYYVKAPNFSASMKMKISIKQAEVHALLLNHSKAAILLQKLSKSRIQNEQVAIQLVSLQIRIAYLALKHTQVQSIFDKMTKKSYSTNDLQVLLKVLLFNTKIANKHFRLLFDTLEQLFLNKKISLEQSIYNAIVIKMREEDYCPPHIATKIYYYYHHYHPQLIIKLLMAHPILFHTIATCHYNQIKTYILNITEIIQENNASQYERLFDQLLSASQGRLESNEALQMFNKIYKIAPSLSYHFALNLANYTLQQQIYLVQQVNQRMTNLLDQHQSSKTTVTPSFQTLIHNFQRQHANLSSLKQLSTSSEDQKCLQMRTEINNKIAQLTNKGKFSNQLINYTIKILPLLTKRSFTHSQYLLTHLQQYTSNALTHRHFDPLFKSVLTSLLQNKIYFKSIEGKTIELLRRYQQLQQSQYLNLASTFPHTHCEVVLRQQIQEIAVNPEQNILSFTLLYSRIVKPSLQLQQFMHTLVAQYTQLIPPFFKLYLACLDQPFFEKLTLEENCDISQFISTCSQNQIVVNSSKISTLFEGTRATSSWTYVDSGSISTHQGCYQQILSKIITHCYPNSQIIFTSVKTEVP